ncbi:BbrUII/HgiDII family restriction enzyme [Micrococcus luteus]|uniref:BbrUII/HgiDII family restriction enzyme n=1 Tax=Micrococcus luteus TaxID=1270 RepID=UPI0020CF6E3A|nr:ATP-binding protein [Micrococcus luteus]UTT45419.1 ATP-binding protein [Micrococcus luteus]
MGKYRMTVGLDVIDSLGTNLYSNAAAVISELVANSYDADATKVSITRNGDTSITVSDNGSGMSVDEINNRFLTVGYRKRASGNEGDTSPKWGRPFMGRKGIGKLSVFSIAGTVEVYSAKDGEANGLRISENDLRDAIARGVIYEPTEISNPSIQLPTHGTTLVLSDLKKKRVSLTIRALRIRLARRFDILDETSENEGGFRIFVDGSPLTWDDRQDIKNLQFVWQIGDTELPADKLPSNVVRYRVNGDVNIAKGWKVTGWFGAARTPTDLTADDDAGSLKSIIILARKRPIQESILDKLDSSRLFGNYVTGQINADFLDDSDTDDIATSDRQRLIEDDERVLALLEYLRIRFREASDTWSKERPRIESERVLSEHTELTQWINSLKEYQRPAARKMLGSIASLEFEKNGEDQRKLLFKSAVLAFARIGLRDSVDDLEKLASLRSTDLLPILSQQAEYEASLWSDIVKSRVLAIQKFEALTGSDEKERVLQEHLFNHLWLLDPSWERVAGSPRAEQAIQRIAREEFGEVDDEGLDKGRVDIRYRTTAGKHLVIELKRYSVQTDIDTLVAQGGRYAEALHKLEGMRPSEASNIEVIFILGTDPSVKVKSLKSTHEYINHQLELINGRIVLYDRLIHQAVEQYAEYLEASNVARDLEAILDSI